MDEITYLIYIISFVLGSVLGLLLSYKKYNQPFVTKKIDPVALIISIAGWFLVVNSALLFFLPSFVSITLGLFLAALVLGMRPGYGRYETVIGILISAVVWLAPALL
ncbi:MAG: DUF2104 domain-containing protein [Euryarchaeota archaeon]|nr:DUF2104 domain-containing protein [Euryarchaeota archaeon]MBU4608115.1 DUF2104 domain-containing protein [Euryarchaeota archaeon]MBV1729827.1 DUF2104 domain-containing protein [Methanobacterium sp.]MBV1755845.1 DUF2104 domain-containing protein [Methanobacterium sp.]MBV1767650.1 DUF2104 domain-containing protein [Methanobacterium sp.]